MGNPGPESAVNTILQDWRNTIVPPVESGLDQSQIATPEPSQSSVNCNHDATLLPLMPAVTTVLQEEQQTDPWPSDFDFWAALDVDPIEGFPFFDDMDLPMWQVGEGARDFGIVDLNVPTQSPLTDLGTPTDLDMAMLAFRKAVSSIPGPPGPFRAETESWLRLPFIPRQYDIELLELLTSIAQRHLSTVFESFKPAATSHEERLPVEVITLASFGAFFSACARGYSAGRLLFNDAHRMVTAYIAASPAMSTMSAAELGSLLRTLLVLELLGLCSGFDRAYTLKEAYRAALLQVTVEYCESIEDASGRSKTVDGPCSTLIYDLLLLDAYRVALFQLQPTSDRFKMRIIGTAVTQLESRAPNQGRHASDGDHRLLPCIVHLSYLARIACTNPPRLTSSHRWSPQTIEYYMHKLLTSQPNWPGPSSAWEILAYTALWTMRTPIDVIQEVATDAARDHKSPGHETALLLSQWHRSDHSLVVFGHIQHVLEVAEKSLATANRYVEAPHEAMSIYLAGLVIWSSRFAKWKPVHSRALRMPRVIEIVSRYRVYVAQSLARILRLLQVMDSD